jgi:hypothetical protein
MLIAQVVNRNNTDLPFNPDEVKRGKEKGWKFLNPEITEANLITTVIPWAGVKEITQIVKGALRQRAMGWCEEAEEESVDKDTNIVDQDKYNAVFNEMAKNYSARGESIPDLKNQIEDKLAEFITAATAEEKMVIAEEIKSLQIAIQSKKRASKEEEAAK